VDDWVARVRERTDAEFIPWLTGYWAQQWLSLRLTWYRMNDESGDPDAAIDRLSDYLREQYHARVIEPVAEVIHPGQIMDRSTTRYVQALGVEVYALPARYGLPQDQFEHWLAGIPAITGPPAASLLDITRAADVTTTAAYQALAAGIREQTDESGSEPSGEALLGFAHRTAVRLGAALALRGGTAAASVAGGLPGLLLGLGVTAWDASRHEQERPAIEAALHQDLDWALEVARRHLLEEPQRGVLAGVTHIAAQLEAVLLEDQIRRTGSAIEVLW
jgi:hypothetical protein